MDTNVGSDHLPVFGKPGMGSMKSKSAQFENFPASYQYCKNISI
jgi:hypothetical protein